MNGSVGGPVVSMDAAMLARIMTVRPIAARVVGLDPSRWPPCRNCGGNVNDCNNYDPDTSAPLWGQDNQEGTRA